MSPVKKQTYFFCGIGGSGMSAIAQVLCANGFQVKGSDRNYDRALNLSLFTALKSQGIIMCEQDGSALSPSDVLVVSSAVEDSIPDVKRAKELGLVIQKRAELLAEIFNAKGGIAVGGTSGKSTVTGMSGCLLEQVGFEPTVVNGGVMIHAKKSPFLGNAVCGTTNHMVIEADESDGTIVLYKPDVAVITNITEDHKTIEELRELFRTFVRNSKAVVLNADCPECVAIAHEVSCAISQNGEYGRCQSVVSFSLKDQSCDFFPQQIKKSSFVVDFKMGADNVHLPIAGGHNVANALTAIAACHYYGNVVRQPIAVGQLCDSMSAFTGVKRRLQVIGEKNGITVVDDFAHNPDKIWATLSTLADMSRRVMVMYQPHGFGPTRFLRDGLVRSFSEGLSNGDILVMPEIYYAGGTAAKDISSADLLDEIRENGVESHFVPARSDIKKLFCNAAKPGDIIVIMGARDDTLTTFAHEVLNSL